ncbi:MAG: carboxypeptidase-like regulatory domain-containing protein, partial [Chthoniobacterales bacterium]
GTAGTEAYEGPTDVRWKWWNDMKKADPNFEWKVPIAFYGRVVDENGRTVSDATVRYGWNDVAGSHEQHTATNGAGVFAIDGLRGKILSVDVSKPGYHSSRSDRHSFEFAAFFEPDYYKADAQRPITFHLTRKLSPQPLVARHISQAVAYDEATYYEIATGKLLRQPPDSPSLKFMFHRAPTQSGEPYNWNMSVEGMMTSLQTMHDEFGQTAPETGYESSWHHSSNLAERSDRTLQAKLYFRTADRRYGRIDVSLANPNVRELGVRLTLTSFLNSTEGNRNLEYDQSIVTRMN